jgi:Protein of unknown function DUF262
MPDLQTELSEQKRKVDFDTFDISAKELLGMVRDGLVDIAPEYQRQFVWSPERQSTFAESVFLGIPVPSLYMAANQDGTWEVIDGVQRLSTLIHFAGDDPQRLQIGKKLALQLTGLKKLTNFNGMRFSDLPLPVQTGFLLKPLKVTTLTDKSDLHVRFDLFERLNTGGVLLTAQEIRACIYRGPFNDFLRKLTADTHFRKVVKLPSKSEQNGTREEFVLRFFAYLHNYKHFEHNVTDFLNEYMQSATKMFDYSENSAVFDKTFTLLATLFPHGISRSGKRFTPANLFEGIAVGAALALEASPNKLATKNVQQWTNSEDLRQHTMAGSNSRKMVKARIEFSRDKFLGK